MTGDSGSAVSSEPARVWTGWAIARVVMAVAWVVWAALAWWSAPRMADSERLHSDLAEGRIRSYSVAGEWQWPRFWAAPPMTIHRQYNNMLVWTTNRGQTYYLTFEDPSVYVDGRPSDDSSPAQSLARELDRADVAPGGVSTVGQVASLTGLLLALVALGILLSPADPVRGTRWFWFWVGQLPLGLGYLAWLAWERPWADPDPDRVVNKRSGFFGLGVLLVGGVATAVLILWARRLFGPWVVPGE